MRDLNKIIYKGKSLLNGKDQRGYLLGPGFSMYPSVFKVIRSSEALVDSFPFITKLPIIFSTISGIFYAPMIRVFIVTSYKRTGPRTLLVISA